MKSNCRTKTFNDKIGQNTFYKILLLVVFVFSNVIKNVITNSNKLYSHFTSYRLQFTSNGRALVHQGSGTKANSTLRINYNGDYGAGTQIDSSVGIKTTPNSSYDLKVNGNTNIGGVLSIAGISNVRTAIENAGGGTTYSAATNGGLALNGSNEFSIDLNNTNADFIMPQRVQIVNG